MAPSRLVSFAVLLTAACFLTAPRAFAQGGSLWPDLSSPPKAVGGGEKDAAVIIGAERYAFVEHVPGARQNADDWQAYLTETLKVPVDRVSLLQNDDVTLEEMRDAAEKAAAQVGAGGTLWFVFIGHGAPSKDGKDGLLIGVDAQQKAQSVYARSLSRNELLRLLAKGKQAKTVVLIDACFSGRAPSGKALVAGLQPLVTMRALPTGDDSRLILMTAARADQFAGPLPAVARPAFSYLALGALRGWAADAKGAVTAAGLVGYVRKSLSLAHDREQTPEISTPATAGMILGRGREAGPDLAKIQREAESPAEPKGAPAPAAPGRSNYGQLDRWEILNGHWEQRGGALCGSGENGAVGGFIMLKEPLRDYAFEATAQLMRGPTWPVVCFGVRTSLFPGGLKRFRSGTSDVDAAYAMNFNFDKVFNLFTIKSGASYLTNPDWKTFQQAWFLDPTRNRIRIEARGDHFVYFLNGHKVYEQSGGVFRDGPPIMGMQEASHTICYSDITIEPL